MVELERHEGERMIEDTKADKAGWRLENSYARLPERFYSLRKPVPVEDPGLVLLNRSLAEELGLDADILAGSEGLQILAGNSLPPGAEPLAQAYGGHQFGYYTRLGDGRAILLGEQRTPEGRLMDIQLKGSGITPYSRNGDGRAGLGPMLREYIISEAMHALGIPTTRSLSVITTGEPVYRERSLPGAVLTRVAASHLRVGTFEHIARDGTSEDLALLADYALKRHYPDGREEGAPGLRLLKEVAGRQAALLAKWMCTGFIHGVMNTDNMAISGETIDYGPCAFMDRYDPETVFSSIDTRGRYAYGNQPGIAQWNLARFAEALLPLLHEEEDRAIALAQQVITGFMPVYRLRWLEGMRSKLGLFGEEPGDEALIEELHEEMLLKGLDFTNTFLDLTDGRTPDLGGWTGRWKARLDRQGMGLAQVALLMKRSNPALVPRNHRVEEALAAGEKGDLAPTERLLAALADPYAHREEQKEYSQPSGKPYRTYCGT